MSERALYIARTPIVKQKANENAAEAAARRNIESAGRNNAIEQAHALLTFKQALCEGLLCTLAAEILILTLSAL